MPSYSRRDQYTAPTAIPVNTANANQTPPSPVQSSPKAVRFAPQPSELVTGVSRPLTPTEAWSLYHFETHARQCPSCFDPARTARHGGRLCHIGSPLAQDVAMHVAYIDNEICSTAMDSGKLVRVEVQYGYESVKSLLKSLNQPPSKSRASSKPIVTYEVKPAMRQRTPDLVPDREETIVEPAHTPSTRRPKRSTRYQVISSADGPSSLVSSEESAGSRERRREPGTDLRRGSLYERDVQRPRKEYRVEIREPADVERRRERERRKEEERGVVERERREERMRGGKRRVE